MTILTLNKGYLLPQNNQLGFEPVTLIVGTFNPIWPEENTAEWFYGRLKNNYLWDVLPRLYKHNCNLRLKGFNSPLNWKQFCTINRIAFTDIIYSINDADSANDEHKDILRTYLDSTIAAYFEDFTFIDITKILENFPSIKNVYLTRQDGIDLFDRQWSLVERYQLGNIERNLHIRKLLTPSANARFQIKEYKRANPTDETPLRNFIYSNWLDQWHTK